MKPPKLDQRTFEALLNDPAWRSRSLNDVGKALAAIYAHYLEILLDRLNRVPERNFLTFLDLLGVGLLPPGAAQAPVVFTPAPTAGASGFVPKGTQVATVQTETQPAVIYETEQDLNVVAAQFTSGYSLDPSQDRYSDRSLILQGQDPIPFHPFAGDRLIDHFLYLGIPTELPLLVRKAGTLKVELLLRQPLPQPLPSGLNQANLQQDLNWQIWRTGDWQPLTVQFLSVTGGTSVISFTFTTLGADGSELNGVGLTAPLQRRWLRSQLTRPLKQVDDPLTTLPVRNIQLRATLSDGIPPDAGATGTTPLDLSSPFYPFGTQPKLNDVFYIASQEAFSQKGATAAIGFQFSRPGAPQPGVSSDDQPSFIPDFRLDWEYFGPQGWQPLGSLAITFILDAKTGLLNTARSGHTATLLPSGKVLVVGGGNSRTSELYDPDIGSWSTTPGQMSQVRGSHTATLLPSGQVLVAGGKNDSSNALSSAELYDPGTGTWSTTGLMSLARSEHTATLLNNGKVLVVGGITEGGSPISAAELYDPASGTWSTTSNMTTVRNSHTAILLPLGQVLVAGGDIRSGAVNSAELYDPATGAWSTTGSMSQARESHTATLLNNGKVLAVGGDNRSSALSSAELYDPATGTWSTTGSMSQARESHTATLLNNGKVLVAGGDNRSGITLSSAELYNPAMGTWNTKEFLAQNLNPTNITNSIYVLQNRQVVGQDGEISFVIPNDIAPTEIAGNQNYWIRARLASGDYGRPAEFIPAGQSGFRQKNNTGNLDPPIVKRLNLTYTYDNAVIQPTVVTHNAFEYLDLSQENGNVNSIRVTDGAMLTANTPYLIDDGTRSEIVQVGTVPPGVTGATTINITPPRSFSHVAGKSLRRVTVGTGPATTTLATFATAGTSIQLAARSGLNPGDWIQIQGNRPTETEFVQLPASLPTVPPLNVTIGPSLQFVHDSGREVDRATPGATPITTLAADATELTSSLFVPIADREPTFYLGLNQALPNDAVNLYFVIQPRQFVETTPSEMVARLDSAPLNTTTPSRLSWQYWNGQQWADLLIVDATKNLTESGIVQFLGPVDFAALAKFDPIPRYWIRVREISGDLNYAPLLFGLFLNATQVVQATTVRNEILGSSNGQKNQVFRFSKTPVFAGQQIFVREPERPPAAEEKALQALEGADAVQIRQTVNGTQEIWVRWHEVKSLRQGNARDRHYIIDRITGSVQFGDGVYGLIPPEGRDNIVCEAYQAGGGEEGNKPAGAISQLKTSIPYIATVTNPIAADGGSKAETLGELQERGPQTLKHRGRAVSAADFEWLARQIVGTRIARAQCLPNRDRDLNFAPGWVTLIIVPKGTDKKLLPSAELISRIEDDLAVRSLTTLTNPSQINVIGAGYVPVEVAVEVMPVSFTDASAVRQRVLVALDQFLHPTTGGMDGTGWQLGRDVYLSELYALCEAIPGVEHVHRLGFKPTVGTLPLTFYPSMVSGIPYPIGSLLTTLDRQLVAVVVEPIVPGVVITSAMAVLFQEGEQVRLGQAPNSTEVTIRSISGNTLIVDPFRSPVSYPAVRTNPPVRTIVASTTRRAQSVLTSALEENQLVNQLIVRGLTPNDSINLFLANQQDPVPLRLVTIPNGSPQLALGQRLRVPPFHLVYSGTHTVTLSQR